MSRIEKAIISKVAFSGDAGIVHVQIEKNGAMAFAAYDNFHEDCVIAYSAVPVAVLRQLVESKVLYSYKAGVIVSGPSSHVFGSRRALPNAT